LPLFENEPLLAVLACSLATVLTKESAFIVHGGDWTVLIKIPEVGDRLGYLRKDGRFVLNFILRECVNWVEMAQV
jgi:hypothetical protein